MQGTHSNTVKLTFSSLMTALAIILSYFPEIPIIPAVPWLKLDFSFSPLLLLGLSIGPAYMILALIVTNTVHILGGTTGGIGELANFLVGSALLLPPVILYQKHRTRRNALIGMVIGVFLMMLVGILANRFILLPIYFPGGIEAGLKEAGNLKLDSYLGFIALFNFVKGTINCLLVFMLYKRLSAFMKEVEEDPSLAVRKP